MSVRTGMYHFEVSRTAMYRVRYVLVRTSTYRHVLPCTRCTRFQMTVFFPVGTTGPPVGGRPRRGKLRKPQITLGAVQGFPGKSAKDPVTFKTLEPQGCDSLWQNDIKKHQQTQLPL